MYLNPTSTNARTQERKNARTQERKNSRTQERKNSRTQEFNAFLNLKYKYFLLIFSFVFTNNLNAQIVEIGISYDEYFAAIHKSNSESVIEDNFEKVAIFYQNSGITLSLKKIVRINAGSKYSSGQLPFNEKGEFLKNVVSYGWSKICFDRDLVVHITGLDLPQVGGFSNGGDLCESNAENYNPNIENGVFGSIVEGIRPVFDVNFAHELGHGFGLIHTENNPNSACAAQASQNALMASSPSSIFLNELEFKFCEQEFLNNKMLPSVSPCVFTSIEEPCIFCKFDHDVVKYTSEFNSGCNSQNIMPYNFTLTNNCIQRDITISFKFYPDEVEVLEKPATYQTITNEADGRKKISFIGQLGIAQQIMHDFKFKILKGEWNNDNSKYSTEIIFRVDYNPVPSGYNPYLGFGPIYFGKEYINLSTAGNLNANQLSNLCNCNNNLKSKKIDLNGTITIDNDFTFPPGSELSMSPSTKIVVKNGKTLDISGCKLYSCNNPNAELLWSGIEVESGGQLIANEKLVTYTQGGPSKKFDCSISDAYYAVNLKNGGIASISNTQINDCYIGINLETGAFLSGFKNNTIQTLNGVKPTTFAAPLWSNNTYIGIKADNAAQGFIGGLAVDNNYGNNFKNLHYGIKSEGADLIIIGNRFENMLIHSGELAPNSNYTYVSGTAIYDVGSVYTYAKGNQVDNCRYGIYGLRTGGDFISNEISNCSTTGILLRDNRSRKIGVANNIIHAGYTGVEFFNINGGAVVNNVISTTASQEGESTTGVICRFGSNNTIADNNISFLNQKPIHVGIASSNGKTHTITNNTIYGYTSPTSKALALLGGNTHTANCNFSVDFKDGIYTDNSTGNTLDCNILESELNDINININSPFQILKGNSFSYNTDVNLVLNSPLGRQEHHGNSWFENSLLGADATALSGIEVFNSKFLVDFTKSDSQNKGWYPKKNGLVNSNPADLFDNVLEPIGKPTYECSGCTYGLGGFGSWFNGSPSPEAICNWLKTTTLRLRPAQIKWWQAYIYRLLKKTGRSYENLSPCLKTIWDSINSTKQKNVETINDKLNTLSYLNQSSTASAYTQVSNIVADATSGQPFDQIAFNAAIVSIRTSIADNNSTESSLFSEINAELIELGTDQSYSDEALLYTAMLDYLQSTILPGNSSIKLIAEKCTDDNGENVYLAKDLMSLIGEVNPLGYDCHDAQNRSSRPAKVNQTFAKVYPTFSSGIYNIDLMGSDRSRYVITVTSLVGEKVKEMIADGGIVSLDLSDNNNGLFIIKIKDVEYASNEYITKVVKVE